MKLIFRAGALALAITGVLPIARAAQASDRPPLGAEQSTTSIDIARIKRVLRLTAAQERYWPPVEAALRSLSRRQVQAEPEGLMHRIGRRVVTVVFDSVAIQRLAVAARPLVAMLDAEQMRAANGLAQEMGLGPVVAALR